MKKPKLMVSVNNDDHMDDAFISEGLCSNIQQIHLIFSMDPVNLYDIPYEGKVKVVYSDSTGYWSTTPYESPVLIDPTWYAILKCAREGIIVTGDYHHVYLEHVNQGSEEGGVKILNLWFGSLVVMRPVLVYNFLNERF